MINNPFSNNGYIHPLRLNLGSVLFALLLTTLCVSCKFTFKDKEADVIYRNAKIYTVDGDFSIKEAMAIKDGKIVAIGAEREILNGYTAARVIDCHKQFIYPGFIDAHCHFLAYGQTLQEVDLRGASSWSMVLHRIADYHQKFPQKQWIIGRGWDQNLWVDQDDVSSTDFPTNAKLNELFPDIPVLLTRVDGHALLLNDKALELAGINVNTQVPGGVVEVKQGKLTGILLDNAMKLAYDVVPKYSREEKETALLDAQSRCFEVGLTTVDDAGLMLEDIQIIKSLHQSGKLKMRIYAMMSDDEQNFDHYLKTGIDTSDYLTVRAFKFYADGALGSRGACLLNPYSDLLPEVNYGLMLNTREYFKMRAEQLNNAGFQMCTHAIGDSANRVILQVYAQELKGVNDKRWRIEHAQVVAPEDVSQFGQFTIIPSVQPTHAMSDMGWAWQRIGRNRMARAYAYQSLKNQLGMLALGTDFPVEGISPVQTFIAAVFRKNAESQPQEGFQMENALSRKDALSGMTIWAAIANFEDEKKGSLEVGKWADFVMLDTDWMTATADQILQTKVLITVSNGEIVFERTQP